MNYFLMKAQKLNPKKLIPNVTKWSIKLDGMRSFWDGGITRGRCDVPFARHETATGLWSINGNVIHAPNWWLDQLPCGVFLDGELWAGIGKFQDVMSICKRKVPDDRWTQVQFRVFEPLIPADMYSIRVINQPTCSMLIDYSVRNYMKKLCSEMDMPWNELQEAETIEQHIFTSLDDIPLDALLAEGHEGIMFRNPPKWEPTRSWGLMKLKPFHDDEAIVTGYIGGDKGFTGKIGSLIVRWYDKTFKIATGMDFDERACNDPDTCKQYAGKQLPLEVQSFLIPTGSVITFKYRELTVDGIPKEARYWRTLG